MRKEYNDRWNASLVNGPLTIEELNKGRKADVAESPIPVRSNEGHPWRRKNEAGVAKAKSIRLQVQHTTSHVCEQCGTDYENWRPYDVCPCYTDSPYSSEWMGE